MDGSGDVSEHGLGRADELVRALPISSREVVGDLPRDREKFDGPLVHMQALKTEHDPVSVTPHPKFPPHVDVDINVNVDLDGDLNIDVPP